MRHMFRTATLLTLATACTALIPGLAAQDRDDRRPIDRWLVTSSGDAIGGVVSTLGSGEERRFPDRAVEVGPGTWRLVRADGARSFRFAGMDAAGSGVLAHAYLKSGAEGFIELDIAAPECGEMRVWLNGQPLLGGPAPWTVALADGWNTLLVGLPRTCSPEVSASLGAARIPLPRDARPLDPSRLRVQASRPPGIRTNVPAGTVTVGMPGPTHLVWRAGSDELAARVEYTVAAWGRDGGSAAPEPEDDEGEREAPPAVDLTGEWSITLYLPMGVERLRARLEMDPDGGLEGNLEGERIDGSLRDGWVSGDRFGWTTRWSGPGGGTDVTFEGRIEDGRMSGDLAFEGERDAEPRPGFETSFGFEGHRGGEDAGRDADPDSTVSATPDEPVPGAGPPGPGATPRSGPLAEIEAIHARIRRQLLPPRRPEAPAPASVSLELRFDGERLADSASGLRPARAVTLSGTVPFEKVREAALDDRGLRVRIAWDGSTLEREGRLPAGAVLEAFHAPIVLAAAAPEAGGPIEGSFRVPDVLDGFTLRTLDGEWAVDGAPTDDGTLCSPCRKGTRLSIRVTGTDEARVRVADPGYPEARDAASAEEWLRALSNGRRYREMGAADGGSS